MLRILKTEYIKRVLAVLLAVTLCLGFASAVFAMEGSSEAEIPETENSETEEVPKVISGTCGANLSWSFSGGTLTISGSGAMENYGNNKNVPWYGFRNEIIRIVFPNGITSIGNMAFYECKNITSIAIPNSVTKIGRYSFAFCEGIKMLNLGNGIEIIDESAFTNCYNLPSVKLPDTLRKIEREAFFRCESLAAITIPYGVTEIGHATFSYCKNLVSAVINANIKVLAESIFYGK